MRNTVNDTVAKEKKCYLEHRINIVGKNNIFKELNALGVTFKTRNTTIPDSLSSPDEMNNFFLSASKLNFTPSSDLINTYRNSKFCNVTDLMEFVFVRESDICKVIDSLKSNVSGYDGISLSLIKYSAPVILPIITHIINFCIGHNLFPDTWKISVIQPLPKIKNPIEYKDIRPISILPTLSKILEKVMAMQIRSHLDKYNIIPPTQSGFRKGYSCGTALLGVIDDIITDLDNDKFSLLILLDFSKAFDTLNHELLLSILQYIGLSHSAVNTLRSYLVNRVQIVKINDEYSNPGDITCGVPQGSILGPLLFTIYTSVFVNCIRYCHYHLYADDTQLYYSFTKNNVHQANQKINADLNNFTDVATKHSLTINPNKSKMILFGKTSNVNLRTEVINKLDIRIKGNKLEYTESAKNLGLIIDYKLRFREHIKRQIQKAYMNLKVIYSCRHYINFKTKILLCELLVLSNFSYLDTVYGPCVDTNDARRVQVVQNSCLRLIYGIRRRKRISHKLKCIPWLNMEKRRYLHSACLFHKIIKLKSPPYLYNKIKFRTDIHNINIRRKDELSVPVHKHSFFERSFSYNVCKVYNSIPPEYKTLPIDKLKKFMRRYLLLNPA